MTPSAVVAACVATVLSSACTRASTPALPSGVTTLGSHWFPPRHAKRESVCDPCRRRAPLCARAGRIRRAEAHLSERTFECKWRLANQCAKREGRARLYHARDARTVRSGCPPDPPGFWPASVADRRRPSVTLAAAGKGPAARESLQFRDRCAHGPLPASYAARTGTAHALIPTPPCPRSLTPHAPHSPTPAHRRPSLGHPTHRTRHISPRSAPSCCGASVRRWPRGVARRHHMHMHMPCARAGDQFFMCGHRACNMTRVSP